jgi:hypothetical protein
MLIERGVFLKLIERFPELRCHRTLHSPDRQGADAFHYAFFDTMIDPETREYLSEDYAFCRLIAQIGITPAVDALSNFTHQGVAVFQGDLARSLELQRSSAR